ncbi:MAG: hypothetical protein WCC87_06235 [Candidatus Korobacteraceae bacterium]
MKLTGKFAVSLFALVTLVLSWSGCSNEKTGPVREAVSQRDTYQEAYVYGFPMLMNYGVMYEYFVDKNSGQYKAPFNQIYNEARVFTPKDTTIIRPTWPRPSLTADR